MAPTNSSSGSPATARHTVVPMRPPAPNTPTRTVIVRTLAPSAADRALSVTHHAPCWRRHGTGAVGWCRCSDTAHPQSASVPRRPLECRVSPSLATLTTRDLSVAAGPRPLLDHVNLVLAPGARLGLVGPN